ncbi:MAG: molybdopterin-dependent oxidoreductase [Rhodospirillales bacterium]|nr:molybdopterin-dependent oxidoreductase [Rhodospirillales bacterium]
MSRHAEGDRGPGRRTRVTTSHWGAIEVTTENDRVIAAGPFSEDPNPPPISDILPAAIHHRTRVARPSVRKGWLEGGQDRARARRGKDTFVELPWDEALDIAGAELQRVRDEHGNGAIFGGSYGWASAGRFHHALSQVHRFLSSIGGYVASVASYSTAGAQAIVPHVFGMPFLKFLWGHQNSWPMIEAHTETLVMFGGINPKNSQVSMGGVTRHQALGWLERYRAKGIHLVNVGPQRTDTIAGSEWLPVIPGTDTALMLGIAHVLETEGLVDRAFLGRCAVGYDRFRPYLLGNVDGQPKSPDWAAEICGIEADTIHALARRMARTRTLITVAWALQRGQHGEQPYWMAAVLAAMLGQIGLPGGGIGYGYGAIGGVGVPLKRLSGLRLPQGDNPVDDAIPVARIADMLLNPGGQYDFNGQSRTYPDIRLVYWCGGNPFHHHQDLHRLNQAWERPDTIIVHEPWWTATAKRADIVFPATTPFEREDIGRSPNDAYLFHMDRLIEPVGEARDDYEIFVELAHRLGHGETFSEGRTAADWQRHLYDRFRQDAARHGVETPGLDELRQRNWVELPIEGTEFAPVPLADFREDPAANPLNTPSGRIEIFSETIADFGYDECPGHPVWNAPDEWLGAPSAATHPLHLVSPQPGDKLHSQMESALADIEGARPMPVIMNPEDARARTISDGDMVIVFNDRGRCRARAKLSDEIRERVVAISTGAWFNPDDEDIDREGNPNVLTRDIGTSRIGQGCTAHTTLVDVARA